MRCSLEFVLALSWTFLEVLFIGAFVDLGCVICAGGILRLSLLLVGGDRFVALADFVDCFRRDEFLVPTEEEPRNNKDHNDIKNDVSNKNPIVSPAIRIVDVNRSSLLSAEFLRKIVHIDPHSRIDNIRITWYSGDPADIHQSVEYKSPPIADKSVLEGDKISQTPVPNK